MLSLVVQEEEDTENELVEKISRLEKKLASETISKTLAKGKNYSHVQTRNYNKQTV